MSMGIFPCAPRLVNPEILITGGPVTPGAREFGMPSVLTGVLVTCVSWMRLNPYRSSFSMVGRRLCIQLPAKPCVLSDVVTGRFAGAGKLGGDKDGESSWL